MTVAIRAEGRVGVVDVQAAQPIEPDRVVEVRERLVERVGVGDVDARDPPVARVEADPEPLVPVEAVEQRGELVDGTPDRAAGPCGVLEDEPEPLVGQLEQLAQRRDGSLVAGARPLPRCDPTWKTTPSAPMAAAVSIEARIAVTDLRRSSRSAPARFTR